MQINKINSLKPFSAGLYCHKPSNSVCTNPCINTKNSSISKEYSCAIKSQKIPFLGKTDETKAITSDFVYDKIIKDTNNYTLEDIEKVYNNISQNVQEQGISVKPSEIKYAMGLLTQFAGVDGIIELTRKSCFDMDTGLYRSNVPDLTQFIRYMQSSNRLIPEEKYDNKKCKDEKKDKKRLQDEAYMGFDHVFYMWDKKGFEYLTQKNIKELKERNPVVLCPTGWERGKTFIDSEVGFDRFEQDATEVIVKAKKQYPDEEFNTALNKVLQDEAQESARQNGLEIDHFITLTPDDKKIELEDILNNINLRVPTKERFEKLVDSITKTFIENDKDNEQESDNPQDAFMNSIANMLMGGKVEYDEDKYNTAKSAILKYFYNTFNAISPRRMADDMTKLYKNIEDSLPSGTSIDNTKIIMPDTLKSHVYIVRQFASANNINPKKIETGEKCRNLQEIQKKRPQGKNGDSTASFEHPYKNDVIVSIDDNSLSGTAINECIDEGFGYGEYPIDLDLNNTYIFGRIYATDNAENIINEEIKKRQAENPNCKDKFVCAQKLNDKTTIPYTKEEKETLDRVLKSFKNSWGIEGYRETKANAVFPLRAPDNNSGLANMLANQFYSDSFCIKEFIWADFMKMLVKQKMDGGIVETYQE